MHSDDMAAAAELVWRHWQEGRVMDGLPAGLRPGTRAEGYAVQALLAKRSEGPPRGWKVAATSSAGQAHIAVDGPLAGRLLAERCFTDGATLRFGANRMRVAEPEFTFRMGATLAPRTKPYTTVEVMAAVAALHPGIEIPDSRFSDFTRVGAAQLIADNACAHEFVLGPPAPGAWRDIDLERHPVHGSVAGRIERDGVGANVLGDPRLALTWLANELSGLGIPLETGAIVTTGTCMPPMAIEPGDSVTADFGVLGRVSARFDGGGSS